MFVNRLVKDGKLPLYFISYKDLRGLNCFAFIISSKNKMQNFPAEKAGIFKVTDYGDVISSGYGKPSEIQLQSLEQHFGVVFA